MVGHQPRNEGAEYSEKVQCTLPANTEIGSKLIASVLFGDSALDQYEGTFAVLESDAKYDRRRFSFVSYHGPIKILRS